jgi:hypothetical protein
MEPPTATLIVSSDFAYLVGIENIPSSESEEILLILKSSYNVSLRDTTYEREREREIIV